jgi:hypothetical protein
MLPRLLFPLLNCPFLQGDHVNRMYEARAHSEVQATMSHATRNRIHSSVLSDLLDQRKHATSSKEVASLANKYGMDIAKLESLSRFVNTPTIGEGTTTTVKYENGEEIITSTASSSDYSTINNY